jgi:hypothetical protein
LKNLLKKLDQQLLQMIGRGNKEAKNGRALTAAYAAGMGGQA